MQTILGSTGTFDGIAGAAKSFFNQNAVAGAQALPLRHSYFEVQKVSCSALLTFSHRNVVCACWY